MKVQDNEYLIEKAWDPYQSASKLSEMFFVWVLPLIKKGKDILLTQSDLFQVRKEDSSAYTHEQYMTYFRLTRFSAHKFKIALFRAFKEKIILTYVLQTSIILLNTALPLMTKQGQSYFVYENKEDKPTFVSAIYFCLLQLAYYIGISTLKPYLQFQQKLLSIQIQGASGNHILTKALNFPMLRSETYNSGELINMLQVDITQASNYFTNAFLVYMIPIQLILAGIIFYVTMGSDAISGASGAVVQAIIGIAFGYVYGQIQNKFMQAKDLRMACVDETLLQVKQIKLNCLEHFFEERVSNYRKDELKYLRYQVWIMVIITFSQFVVQGLAFEITFLFGSDIDFTFYLVLGSNYVIFVTLLQTLPTQLKNYYLSKNSMQRLNQFFGQQEIRYLNRVDTSNHAISITNGAFNWNHIENDNHETFGIELNLKIKKGQFVAIVGSSASGKSSILKSIIGEMNQLKDPYVVNGKFSVCMQEPWIINGTVKENITYLQEYDEQRYKKIIQICGLDKDLQILKDQNISEKGDNLSGGQRKRINLARTIYQQSDIYLLDDPLSALDIKVQYQVHYECFVNYLKDKTRVIFTNNFQNLQNVDYIYVIENGKVIQEGTFNQIHHIDESKVYQFDYQFEGTHYTDTTEYSNPNTISTEDQEIGAISSKVKKQIFKLQGGWWTVGTIFVLFLFGVIPSIFGNLKMADDQLTNSEFKSIALVYYPIVSLCTALTLAGLMALVMIRGLKASKIVHKQVITSLIYASFTKFYNNILLGRLMNRLSKDIYNIDLQFPQEFYQFILSSLNTFTAILSAVIFLNLVVSPFVIVYLALIIYISLMYYRCLTETTRIESVSKSPIFNYFQQIVRGISFNRSCLPVDQIITIQQSNIDKDLSNQICLYGLQSWYQLYTGLITNIFQVLLFILCFLYPGSTQNITYGILSNLSVLSIQIMTLTFTQGNILMYSVSFERCLHLAQNIDQDKLPVNHHSTKQLTASSTAIQFKDASFRYKIDSSDVLKQLTCQIKSKEKIGIVGRTGSGKSSIIMALTNMLEQVSGDTFVNDQNINQIDNIRQYYAIIPQDPLIFLGSLSSNLDPLKLCSQTQLEQVFEICSLKDFESFKKDGLSTEIAIAGSNLSISEKQLLSIARCLISRKPIILIDEATACIDKNTEEKIKLIFENHLKESTVLTIAHKVSTIMESDRIIVVNSGRITEFDSPSVLLQTPQSEFKQIVDLINKSEQY